MEIQGKPGKRKGFTLEFKVRVLDELKIHSRTLIAQKYGLTKSTVATFIHNEAKTREALKTATFQPGRKKLRTSNETDVENCLYDWFKKMRARNNAPISSEVLRMKAEEFGKELGLPDFKPPLGWVERFKNRKGLCQRQICRDSTSGEQEEYIDWAGPEDVLSQDYSPDEVYSTEETTGLFHSMADDHSVTTADSRHSNSPATPGISNPGTPRSELPPDIRATPPLARANTPLARATPPLPRATPPLNQAQLNQMMIAPPVIPVRTMAQPAGPSPLAQMHQHHQSKYASLLAVIEDMGRDIRPTYAGNRSSTERLKRSIVHSRILVRECLMECEKSART